ncbi:hypothetical protein N7486_003434 [Penicillium sp. IBT 16267x]|nr:hypothetical protein N7486_003434 [Penicillium sp. IBT 16267x]
MASQDTRPENINSVTEKPGDLFDAPPRAGIARQFAREYPWAYKEYRQHCLKWKRENKFHDIPNLHATGDEAKTISVRYPVGTALVIYPETSFFSPVVDHWVICLFTSAGYGKGVDSPETILNSTNAALHDLRQKLDDVGEKRRLGQLGVPGFDQLYACRFNSGLFGVPWAKTRELVDGVVLGLPLTIVYPPEEADEENEALKERALKP